MCRLLHQETIIVQDIEAADGPADNARGTVQHPGHAQFEPLPYTAECGAPWPELTLFPLVLHELAGQYPLAPFSPLPPIPLATAS